MVTYLLGERPYCKEDYFFLSVHAPPYVKLNTTRHIVKATVSDVGVGADGRLYRHQNVLAQRSVRNAKEKRSSSCYLRRVWTQISRFDNGISFRGLGDAVLTDAPFTDGK